jgi:hypothetical protein
MDYGSGTSRRQTRQQQQRQQQNQPQNEPQNQPQNQQQGYPYGTYDVFNSDTTQSQSYSYNGQYFSGYSIYEQSGPQLFEDTSGQQFVPQTDSYESQSHMSNANTFMPQTYGMSSQNLINQQLLMSAGQQLLTNPMAAAALDAYSQSIVNKSKSWIGNNVKYYFAVDTSYVLKKLLLLFFPFTHKVSQTKFLSTH